jgi:hypothetical protein
MPTTCNKQRSSVKISLQMSRNSTSASRTIHPNTTTADTTAAVIEVTATTVAVVVEADMAVATTIVNPSRIALLLAPQVRLPLPLPVPLELLGRITVLNMPSTTAQTPMPPMEDTRTTWHTISTTWPHSNSSRPKRAPLHLLPRLAKHHHHLLDLDLPLPHPLVVLQGAVATARYVYLEMTVLAYLTDIMHQVPPPPGL